jgi:hypothetical protein
MRSLEAMRTQKKDKRLAWLACLVLHVPEYGDRPVPCDEPTAIAIHQKHAPPFPPGR